MFLTKDLHMKVFFLQKIITCFKIEDIIVRAIERMIQFSFEVDTVLQQYELKIICFYLIHTVVIQMTRTIQFFARLLT